MTCVRYPNGFEGRRKPSRLVQWRTYANEMEKQQKFCSKILKKHTKELLLERQRSKYELAKVKELASDLLNKLVDYHASCKQSHSGCYVMKLIKRAEEVLK